MRIELPYAGDLMSVELNDDAVLGALQPASFQPLPDLAAEARIVLNAFPLARQLARRLRGGGKVVILVPDKTRNAHVTELAPAIVDFLCEQGVSEENVSFMFALGRHAKMTDQECRAILGDCLFDRFRTEQSVALESEFVEAGVTSFGNRVALNRSVMQADALFGINKTFFHYFAGFGGGRKLILPGAASEETILFNHGLMVNSVPKGKNPACASGNLDENPIHLDMLEGAKFAPEIFILNLVANHRGEPAAVIGGGLEDGHAAACKLLKARLTCPIREAADFVIASCGGHPQDINFLQSHKALDNAFRAVKPGGTLVLLAACPDGWGSAYLPEWLEKADLNLIERELRKGYESHGQTAHAILEKTSKVNGVLISGMSEEETSIIGMRKAESLSAALELIPELNSGARGYVMPFAAATLPT